MTDCPNNRKSKQNRVMCLDWLIEMYIITVFLLSVAQMKAGYTKLWRWRVNCTL